MAEAKRLPGRGGRIGFVDLASHEVRTRPTEDFVELVGGRGMAAGILFEEVSAGVSPLEPGNVLVFMTGPLTGTLAPSSSRLCVVGKNTLTRGYASANMGGHFGPELKFAGFDGIVVRGKAPAPVYLLLHDGRVEIREAGLLWGRGTAETQALLRWENGNPHLRVAAIGPAGENLCRFACIVGEGARAAGYGGLGAVMGAKNLKAIAAVGAGSIPVADPERLATVAEEMTRKVWDGPSLTRVRRYGTLLAGGGGLDGTLSQPVRNQQDGYWPGDKSRKMHLLLYREFHERKQLACFACPTACGRFYEVACPDGSVLRFQGMQANSVQNFGSLLDIEDHRVPLVATSICNELGLDVDGASCALAWAFEAFEKGILTADDADGLELAWGKGEAVPVLLWKMARREGIGDLLADGAVEAARRLGAGAEFVMHIKGAPMIEPWMQTDIPYSLGVALSTRGSGHLNGAIRMSRMKTAPERVRAEMARLGLELPGDDSSPPEIARAVAWFEDFKAVVDMVGVCYFTSWWTDPYALGPDEYARLLWAVTGEKHDGASLLTLGGVVHNLERAFNTLHAGFGRQDDRPPARLFTSPISAGPNRGAVLDDTTWDRLLDGYYEARQYDRATGRPTAAAMASPLLTRARNRLQAAGLLVRQSHHRG